MPASSSTMLGEPARALDDQSDLARPDAAILSLSPGGASALLAAIALTLVLAQAVVVGFGADSAIDRAGGLVRVQLVMR